MIEIKITKSINSSKIKELQKKYLKKSNAISSVKLILPVEINKYKFGLLGDLLQFIISINKKTPISILQIELDNTEEAIKTLYDQEYTYPIISLLWNSVKFIDSEGNQIKEKLREYQNDFFVKMNSQEKLKGNKFILTNIDHFSDHKGLIRLLETSNGYNDNEMQIVKSIRKVLSDNVLTFNKSNFHEIENIIEDIGGIVYELTKNTFEWGKTDSEGIEILPSIRGVYLKFYNNKNEKIIEDYKNTPLESFFSQQELIDECLNESGNIYYLEILVYDSGVGFIDKFLSKGDFSDLDVIKKCLIKNQTSSISNLKSKKGIGLDRILNILDKKGFIKISTDKYCVYRNMIKNEYLPIDINKLDSLVIEDWNNKNFNSTVAKKITGSYLSILYPFKSNK